MDQLSLDQIQDDLLPILVIIVVGLLFLRFAPPVVRRLLHRVFSGQTPADSMVPLSEAEVQKRVDTVETLAMSTIRIVIVGLVLVLILAILNLGPVIAGLGIVIAAIAFAGQDFVRDYLSGLVILVENQFYIGDVLRVGTVSGTVEDFTLRRTKLRDVDGTLHIVANGEIRIASNQTRGYGGINLEVPVSYGADVDRAMKIIDEVGAALAADPEWADRVLEVPIAARVGAFGDAGLSITVVGKVRAGEQWTATGELRRRILTAFAEAGVSLPHRSVVVERAADEFAPHASTDTETTPPHEE
jgi:small conductance mechanosensitive channel